MKRTILCFATLAMTAVASQAAITIYNQNNPPDGVGLPSGGWGTYRGFSVNFADPALSTDTTGGEPAPVLTTIFLQDLTFRHSGAQGAQSTALTGDWTAAIIKVYTTQVPTTASYVGDSMNANDVGWNGSERNVSYSFNNLAMVHGQQYFFYFANTAGNEEIADVTWTAGRLRVSNNAAHTYPSGNLVNQTWGNQDTAFDGVFAATFIPEPSVALLGGLGLLGLLIRRRN